MTERLLVLLGTKKGAFILDGRPDRRAWNLRGPLCDGWPIHHLNTDPESGTLYAAGGNEWYGPAVWKSADVGATWTHSSAGLAYGDGGPKVRTVWNVTPAHGVVYAGVQDAGLFRSEDDGATWSHVEGLRRHPSTPGWTPGAGGLCLHSIVPDAEDPRRLSIAISAVGTFVSTDGGTTWEARNRGVRAEFMPDRYPETGQCVHKLAAAPGRPERLYQQNHCGVYRSDDRGDTWQEITGALPSDFGFPLVTHPRDPETIFTIPLSGADKGRHMIDGRAAVYRSRDAGASWTRLDRGLPQQGAFVGVLREAMAVDRLDPAGIYVGTSTGQLFASHDEGEHWELLADYLPPIWSVETLLTDG